MSEHVPAAPSPGRPTPSTPASGAPAPLLLLPVRLETRFTSDALLIRIYPDDIHADSHEPELTASEVEAGQGFWAASTGIAAESAGAWRALAGAFGPARAAWIARSCRAGSPGAGRAASWSRAPLARLLPSRWQVRGYRADAGSGRPELVWEVQGADIPGDLPVGPDPMAVAPDEVPEGEVPVDPGMRWMVDFEEALSVGMAVRVPAEDDALLLSAGVDALYVVGVNEPRGAEDGARAFADLLEAHYYSDGFAVLEPGTPTNNTDRVRAGAGVRGEATGENYRLGDAAATVPGPRPAGTVAADLSAALGLGPAPALARAEGGDRVDHQRAANTVTWQAHWGYFLTNILRTVPPDVVQQVRAHLLDHVRPGGQLPVLRLGDQPYGVLPVLAPGEPATGVAADPVFAWIRQFLNQEGMGRPGPRVGTGDTGDGGPAAELLEVLAIQPGSVALDARPVLGDQYLEQLASYGHLLRVFDHAEWVPRSYGSTLDPLDLHAEPHSLSQFAEDSFGVPGPFLDPNGHNADMLNWLAGVSYTELLPVADTAGSRTPQLFRILRHALLQEVRNALWIHDGHAGYDLEQELVDLDPDAPPSPTPWRRLAGPPPAGAKQATLGAYLTDPATVIPATAQLRDFRAALRELATRPEAELDRLLRGALDIAAYRRDAWHTSLATSVLAEQRRTGTGPRGVLLGGYGWALDVRPRELSTMDPVRGEEGPLHSAPGDAGCLLAPSLHHATTAAILRAGDLAHRGGLVSINLDARQARVVRELVEGTRAGLPLATLLGYRFERCLTEPDAGVARGYLPAFRALAPVRTQVLAVDNSVAEAARPGVVVDGLALLALHRAGSIRWGQAVDPAVPAVVLPATGTPAQQQALAALGVLAEALDALADATLAEGVHQLAGGNHTRAGAVLDALGKGEVPVPELEVLRTERTGARQHHRLLALTDVNESRDAMAWPVDGDQVRALAEPSLNGWAACLLGDPGRVRLRGVFRRADGGVHSRIELPLTELRLSPLDLVCLAAAAQTQRDEELGRRAVAALERRRPADLPSGPAAEPDFERDPAWARTVLGVRELLTMAADVAALLAGARPVRGTDLAEAGTAIELVWETDARAAKVTLARTRLSAARDALSAAVTARDFTAVTRQLTVLAAFGIPGAFPRPGRVDDPQWTTELTAVAQAVAVEATRRLTEADRLRPGATAAELAAYQTGCLRALLGEEFPTVATWHAAGAGDRAVLHDLLGHGADLLADDPLATGPWLDQLARVRAGAGRLRTVLAAAEATGAPATQDLLVGQLPCAPGERWAALPGPDAAAPRTSVAVHTPRPPGLDGSLAGLVLDDWTETVPGTEEVAGLTFRYDAPGARAPQSLLLGLSTQHGPTWTTAAAFDVVTHALQVARVRTAHPETVGCGHFLPAMYFPINAAGDTVSTDFAGPLNSLGAGA